MNKVVTVQVECPACRGTGVYCGFAEPKGTGVICVGCEGSGKATLKYRPFTKRNVRRGVKLVRRSRGAFIGTGAGPVGDSVSYQEFLNGKRPRI